MGRGGDPDRGRCRTGPAGPGRVGVRGRAADFPAELQHAVDGGDRRVLAALARYPAWVLASGFNIPVKDETMPHRLKPDAWKKGLLVLVPS